MLHLSLNRLQCGKPGFDPRVGKIPWRRERLPTPIFWPGEFHGVRHNWATFTFSLNQISLLIFTTTISKLKQKKSKSIKWALGNITTNKVSGGDGIPVELFQILKDAAVKVLHSKWQHIWKTRQWPQDWKRSIFIPIPKKGNTKECWNYCTIALISHANK